MTEHDTLAHLAPAVTLYRCDDCDAVFAGTHTVETDVRHVVQADYCRECRPVEGVDGDAWNVDRLRARNAEAAERPGHGVAYQHEQAAAHREAERRDRVLHPERYLRGWS